MNHLLVFVLAIVSAAFAKGDDWGMPKPTAYASHSGQLVLRIVPGIGKPSAMAQIFQLSAEGQAYVLQREFPLLNRLSPVTALISDEGEVFTFDDWRRAGYDHAFVWYSADGTVKRELRLAQIFPEKQLKELRDKRMSVSSIHWREGTPWTQNACVYINDTLGGQVSITEDQIVYEPQLSTWK